MTEEDKAKMSAATVQVWGKINGLAVGAKEIRETLWYYYFDVDKSVGYLRGSLGVLCRVSYLCGANMLIAKYDPEEIEKKQAEEKAAREKEKELKKQQQQPKQPKAKNLSRFDQAAAAADERSKSGEFLVVLCLSGSVF
jgi:HBS1 N-terminus